MIKVDGKTTGTYDGIVYIISGDKAKQMIVPANGVETDKFVSLEDCLAEVGCGRDGTAIVIIEDALHGDVYRYNNFCDRAWYKYGETEGYA